MAAIKVLQVGLGPLGQKMTRFLAQRPGAFEIVGAVDIDPDKTGKDLGDIAELGEQLGVTVSDKVGKTIKNAKPQAAILTTVSDMQRIEPQIEAIVERGIPVVSTCEELSFPWEANPKIARRIDKLAKKHDVAVLGTGINPGFLMDFLPTTLTGVCQRVDAVKVWRVQDAQHRRIPFQKKIGAGLTLDAFEAKRQTGTLRHVGLAESVAMIAHRMGWQLDNVVDELSPVVAEHEIVTNAMTIPAGDAMGVKQIGRGFVDGEERITLTFIAAVGQANPRDTVEILGEPNLLSTIDGGVNGDIATCAITINAVKQILRANAGLVTMTDIPVVSFFE
jgi:4-hydroxy-tetrahydrodipicolinate reductase